MSFLEAIFLGIVEGVTEFLPISSTFHLIVSSRLLGIHNSEFLKTFEIVIQAGAILSVVALYLKELLSDRKLFSNIVVSFIPTGIVGFALYKVIKGVFFEAQIMTTIVFMAVGLVFILLEKFGRKGKGKPLQQLSSGDAFVIGLSQSLSVVPGVSRAGAALIGGMARGLDRAEAAKYSFMLSIPTIFAASGYDLLKSSQAISMSMQELWLLGIGFIAAFISSLFAVRWLIGYLKKYTLNWFGVYRIAFGALLLWYFLK